jgi:hypothetical protein
MNKNNTFINQSTKRESAVNKLLYHSCTLFLLILAGAAMAGIDDFEDPGPNYTVISERVIEGITITLSNARGWPFLLVTYNDPSSHCFVGANDGINAPADPAGVSGTRFISTADDINLDMPIVFDFSTPVGIFGLTTIDVLEDVETSADAEVRLQGFNGDQLVAEHVMTGIQGGSGVVLNWEITSEQGFTRAVLVRTAGTISAGYGIDDLEVVSLAVPTENTTFGGVKALFR